MNNEHFLQDDPDINVAAILAENERLRKLVGEERKYETTENISPEDDPPMVKLEKKEKQLHKEDKEEENNQQPTATLPRWKIKTILITLGSIAGVLIIATLVCVVAIAFVRAEQPNLGITNTIPIKIISCLCLSSPIKSHQ